MSDNSYNNWPQSPTITAAPELKSNAKWGPETSAYLSPANHAKLVNHLLRLVHTNNEARLRRNADMMVTENDLLGAVIPTGTDCQRATNRAEIRDVSVPDSIYPYGWVNIQRFVADLMELIFPVEAPYAVATDVDTQTKAQAFVKAFRHQGVQFDHRTNLQNAVFDAVALDFGALEFCWSSKQAASTQNSLAGTQISNPMDIRGVELRQLDPYNVCYDESCSLPDLAEEGEFCAIFDVTTPFKLRRAAHRGKNFLSHEIMEDLAKKTQTIGDDLTVKVPDFNGLKNWFYFQPAIAQRRAEVINQWGTNRGDSSGNRVQTGFSGLFTGNQVSRYSSNLIHVMKIYARIQPGRFGLRAAPVGKKAEAAEPFEIWEFHIVGEGYLCYAAPVQAKADRLPVALSSMNFKRTRERSLNLGHHFAQMSLLISTILNMHKRSMRKGLEGGLTLYNADVLNLADVQEVYSGRVPVRMRNFDQDIRKHVVQLSDTPDYKNTIMDAQRLMEIMNAVLPTNAQPAMAGLDRATTYQAQAVMVTAMRGLVMYATTLDSQFLVPARFYMHHMNMLNQADLTYVDETTSNLIQLSAQDMQATSFALVQAQPLMGIDRLRIENILREMLTILVQTGGQFTPVQAMLVRHWFGVAAININEADYEKAVQKELEMADQKRQQEAQVAQAKAQAAQTSASQP